MSIVRDTGVFRARAVSTKPTEIDALASELITILEKHFDKRIGPPIIHFGIVTDTDVGPPSTITVLIQGAEFPNIRYIGTVPTIDDTVLLLMEHTTYVCLGVLTP